MKTLIRDITIVNEDRSERGSVLIDGEIIARVIYCTAADYAEVTMALAQTADEVIEAEPDAFLMPGVIDDQVHFREPGATHKGDIASESAAGVLGGVTSFMDMPNNAPPVCTLDRLEEKYGIAAEKAAANYSFYLGASNDNIDELRRADFSRICGIKVFMGSSTGNMLVDSQAALEEIFSMRDVLTAVHCEDESTIRTNLEAAKNRYGEDIPFSAHPQIRSREACVTSSRKAMELAARLDTRLHVLHISTADELRMLAEVHKANPQITGEICVHYLWLDSSMYDSMGSKAKCNPAIKDSSDREAIIEAVRTRSVQAVATDHAPHTLSEKEGGYLTAPSGLPTLQHSLQLMLQLVEEGRLTRETVVWAMCHAPADTFRIDRRGYIREGYWADLTIVRHAPYTVTKDNVAYHCGWSPFEGTTFAHTVTDTFVSGAHTVRDGKLTFETNPKRLKFKR